MLKDKNVTLFITGGLAAYQMPNLVIQLQQAGANVQVVLTEHAQQFLSPLTFKTILGEHIYTDMFSDSQNPPVVHIQLADWTQLAIIAPATANIIGKMANGIADDLTTSTLAAIDQPKIVFPAMTESMLMNPAVQRNLQQLATDGLLVQDARETKGQLPQPAQLFATIVKLEGGL